MKTDNYTPATNYSDIYFDYILQNGCEVFTRTNTEAVIFFVYSGRLDICCSQEKISLTKGQYAFIKHDVITTINKYDCGNDKFCCAYMGFSKKYLFQLYQAMDGEYSWFSENGFPHALIKLPYTPCLQSLYISLIPYLEYGVRPSVNILELKRQEGIYSLILTDERFYPCLFDFVNAAKNELPINYINKSLNN